MQYACVICAKPSDQARCPQHRYQRDRSPRARSQRQRVLERDGYRCTLCGKQLDGGRESHIDHITPLSQGGSGVTWCDDNCRATCASCNLGRPK
jgi:5-methylcytosine-specific restriction endonuclease McrA